MTIESPAYVISALSHSAALFRQAAQANLCGSGVVQPGTGALAVAAQATPNMTVAVAPGSVWIPGTLGASIGFPANAGAQTTYGLPSGFTSQGCYEAYNDGTVNLTITAANPTNPRIDLICASIDDAQYAGSLNMPVLQVITGTAAASPTAPAAPASTVVLAAVLVAAGVSSIVGTAITNVAPAAIAGALTWNGTAYVPYPAAGGRLYMSAAQQIISNATAAQLTPLSTDYLTGGVTAPSSNLVVPAAGRFRYTANTPFQNTNSPPAAGRYTTIVERNGSILRQFDTYLSSASAYPCPGGTDHVQCAAGDTFTLWAFQSTGGTQGVCGSGTLSGIYAASLAIQQVA